MVEIISTAGLTERRRHLLNIVIQEYIHTAQPVGSSNIVRQHDLGVSSATIRNDLAALEKEGLLTHPSQLMLAIAILPNKCWPQIRNCLLPSAKKFASSSNKRAAIWTSGCG
jgi:DeoR/GlpR family transcriptional regulator of sugar metabolism